MSALVGVELRLMWNGGLRVTQLFKAWEALEAAATEKRQPNLNMTSKPRCACVNT